MVFGSGFCLLPFFLQFPPSVDHGLDVEEVGFTGGGQVEVTEEKGLPQNPRARESRLTEGGMRSPGLGEYQIGRGLPFGWFPPPHQGRQIGRRAGVAGTNAGRALSFLNAQPGLNRTRIRGMGRRLWGVRGPGFSPFRHRGILRCVFLS